MSVGSIPLCVLSALSIRGGGANKDIDHPSESCAVLFVERMYQIQIAIDVYKMNDGVNIRLAVCD